MHRILQEVSIQILIAGSGTMFCIFMVTVILGNPNFDLLIGGIIVWPLALMLGWAVSKMPKRTKVDKR